MLVRKPSQPFSDYIEWFITSDYYINININNKKKVILEIKLVLHNLRIQTMFFQFWNGDKLVWKLQNSVKWGQKEF